MRGTALAWGAGWMALASVAPLGCSLVESTGGLSGSEGDGAVHESGVVGGDDAPGPIVDTGASADADANVRMDAAVADTSSPGPDAADASDAADSSSSPDVGADTGAPSDSGGAQDVAQGVTRFVLQARAKGHRRPGPHPPGRHLAALPGRQRSS